MIGQVTAPARPGAAPAGVQYIVGTPPQTPVLRPLRQPIFDSELLPGAPATFGETQIHVDPRNFALTGAPKGPADTNMTQPSSLGTPLEFDLVGFNFQINRGVSRVNSNTVYNNGAYEWIFGQSTRWLNTQLSRVPEGVAAFGSVSTAVAGTEASILSNGWPQVTNLFNFTTPDRLARRITSTESFRLILRFNAATAFTAGTGDTRLTNFMLGIL